MPAGKDELARRRWCTVGPQSNGSRPRLRRHHDRRCGERTNIGDSKLYYSYAGHPPVLVHAGRADSGCRLLSKRNRAKPTYRWAFFPLFSTIKTQYGCKQRDRFFLYTDGLTEATDPNPTKSSEKRKCPLYWSAGRPGISERERRPDRARQRLFRRPTLTDDCTLDGGGSLDAMKK